MVVPATVGGAAASRRDLLTRGLRQTGQESRSIGRRATPSVTGMNISTRAGVNWAKWFRQVHRWLAVVFTVSIVVTTVALLPDEPLIWVSYVPLLPLACLLLTGLYMFAQPYVIRRRRAGRRAA